MTSTDPRKHKRLGRGAQKHSTTPPGTAFMETAVLPMYSCRIHAEPGRETASFEHRHQQFG